MNESSKSVIYIDIDSLIDVRTSIIKKIAGEDRAFEIVTSDAFNFRTADIFDINMDDYLKAYQERSKEDIENGVVSYMFNILKNRTKRLLHLCQTQNTTPDILIYLNIYPYKLTIAQANAIAFTLEKKLQLGISVVPINMELKDITPLYIKSHQIKELFIYDSSTWLKENTEAATKASVQNIVFNFPAITAQVLDKDNLKKLDESGFKDIFSLTEFILSPIITAIFVPVIFYTNVILSSSKISEFIKTNPSVVDDLNR